MMGMKVPVSSFWIFSSVAMIRLLLILMWKCGLMQHPAVQQGSDVEADPEHVLLTDPGQRYANDGRDDCNPAEKKSHALQREVAR